MTRYDHDDCAGKCPNNTLRGAVDEEDDNNDGELDAMAKAQEEAEALVSLATGNRTLREARDKHHQMRMSCGYFLQQLSERDHPTKRPERKCVICNGPIWAPQCPEKQGKPEEQNGEATAHTAHSEFAMTGHTKTSMFARNRKSID